MITTNYARVLSALSMRDKGNFFIELAKTSAWNDDAHPDTEDPTTQTLPETQAFIKASKVIPVYKGETSSSPDDTDSYIVYKGTKWLFTDDANAYNNNAHYLLIQATLDVQELPPFTYHQIGVRQGASIPANTNSATADAVTNKGILISYDNISGQNYTNALKIKVSYIMEF